MKQITRDQAIEALRAKLLTLADAESSMCKVAARRGMFCHGFAQWSTDALRRRFRRLLRHRPGAGRAEIEDRANRWLLERQRATGMTLSCDVQADACETHRVCPSWEGFSDPQIAAYCRDLLGEEVEIVSTAA